MLKRLFDILVSGTLLIVFAPLILLTALAVRWKFGAPILFRQRRPGLRGKLFMMYKFRTMLDSRDASGQLLPDDERQTRFGRFLRSSSLDELPELWNVLRGDMSLVVRGHCSKNISDITRRSNFAVTTCVPESLAGPRSTAAQIWNGKRNWLTTFGMWTAKVFGWI